MKREEVTGDLVREWLDYEPDSGVLMWRKKKNGAVIGRKAGRISREGYVIFIFFGMGWFAHRIIWLHVHDRLPNDQIDHINGTRDDNRLCNLREVTALENQRNTYMHRAGRRLGARFVPKKNAWLCQGWFDGENKRLGYFKTEMEAHNAWRRAKGIEEIKAA